MCGCGAYNAYLLIHPAKTRDKIIECDTFVDTPTV